MLANASQQNIYFYVMKPTRLGTLGGQHQQDIQDMMGSFGRQHPVRP